MKIYLAGKIYRNDWRHCIVDGLGEVNVCAGEWPILRESIFATHDYVGPYFLSLGHGQSHCPEYVHATNPAQCHRNGGEAIVEQCMSAIESCDLLFAYIQTRDCFGTFCEIGYAIARKRKVVICYAPFVNGDRDDLWFLSCAAWTFRYGITDPERELRRICPQVLPVDMEREFADYAKESLEQATTPRNGQIDWRLLPDGKERRQAYYCSTEWEKLRKNVIARAHGFCEICKSEPIYAVHHLTYARLYKEDVGDLQGLCEQCHRLAHPSRQMQEF